MTLTLTSTLRHFLSLLLLCFAFVSASEDEVRSLLEFKKGIKEDPLGKVFNSWNHTFSADPVTCPRSFYGIDCGENGFVSAIALDRLSLSGDLKFFTLNGLKMLRNLSLSGNSFTGRLVPALGLMTSLQHLDLSGNLFYGPIPARITDLWALNYLNLSNNNLSGWFPGGIQNLQQLKVLDLHSNALRGDIQSLFSELRNLEYVDLSYNTFYGSLPMGVANISSVANTVLHINLSHNRLGGWFFSGDSIALFRNLQVLDLGDNELFGELPSFGPLPNLRVLRLGNNKLFGPIPEELLGSSTPLVELDLSGNGFSGSIHGINSTTLTTLNLSSNVLSGSLPRAIGNCHTLDLSQNALSDNISIIQTWTSTLEILDLSSNKLTGTIPNLTSQFQTLTILNIRNNSLVGNLPPDWSSYMKLSIVDLSLNELEGTIPRSLFTSPAVVNLNLSGNHFTGSIPLENSHTSELLVLPSYPKFESLDLSKNTLTGTIAPGIGNLGRLGLLNLANNRLQGQLPNELSKLNGLEYLDLSSNNFTGTIPDKLPSNMKVFNVSYNNLSGSIPENLRNFSIESFRPGNDLLVLPNGNPSRRGGPVEIQEEGKKHHASKSSIRIAIIAASVGAATMIAFVLFAYRRAQLQDFNRRNIEVVIPVRTIPTSLSFSNDRLLGSKPIPLPAQSEAISTEITAPSSSSSSPRFIEQSINLNVHSPDRLVGELFFLDSSMRFTAEELSRAPAEVLGRSSHGTMYKATLESRHVLSVKWLRVGLVKGKKEFAKEVKKIGLIRHPNVVPLRAYYWGPKEQERLLLADYVHGDSLALHLYETTPRKYSLLSFRQRLKIALDVARSLSHLHDQALPHGNLKPTNILLAGPQLDASLTDYGLHRLMTPAGISEQILNLGALGYRAPDLASKQTPSLKSDVYAFGVIVMELLTRRSAGDIISGQSGAVDLTDWVRLCDREGRGTDCIDRDIAGVGEGGGELRAMEELLAISIRCILPVNERPNIRQVLQDLCAISV